MLNKLQQLLHWSAFIGLAPIGQKLKSRYWHQVYIGILMLLNMFLMIYSLNYAKVYIYGAISNVVAALVMICHVLTATVIYLEVIYFNEKHFEWLQQIFCVERSFRQHFQMSLKRWQQTNAFCKKYLIYIILMFVSTGCSDFVVYRFKVQSYLRYTVPALMINHLRGLQLIMYVDILADFLEQLNKKLKSIANARLMENCKVLDVNYKELRSISYLVHVKKIYSEIYKLNRLFNNLYGWSLFVLVSVMLFDIIILNYWSVLSVEGVYPIFIINYNISCLVPRLLMLILLCQSCECCKRQCHNMLNLARKLITCNHTNLNLALYNETVKNFYLQMQQCPIEIDGWGFFTLNYNCLLKVITIKL